MPDKHFELFSLSHNRTLVHAIKTTIADVPAVRAQKSSSRLLYSYHRRSAFHELYQSQSNVWVDPPRLPYVFCLLTAT
jgi:hypothetical protein